MDTVSDVRKGGSWLLEDVEPSEVFTPEKLSDEHRLIAQTTDEFIDAEVLPNLDRLETKDWALARTLIRRSGELGLLGTNVPEQYGGLDLDKVSSLIVAERIARSASFATTYGGQVNLCILPIVLFGTEARNDNTCRRSSPASSLAPTLSANRDRARTRLPPGHGPPGNPMERGRSTAKRCGSATEALPT